MNVINLARQYENLKKSINKHTDIQLTDNREMIIDNCMGMISYDENFIKLRLGSNVVSIVGLDLKLKNYGKTGIIISGSIKSINFEDMSV